VTQRTSWEQPLIMARQQERIRTLKAQQQAQAEVGMSGLIVD
jgi:hypothetical protein